MARPERVELPTFWFVAKRSIQLSYGRADATCGATRLRYTAWDFNKLPEMEPRAGIVGWTVTDLKEPLNAEIMVPFQNSWWEVQVICSPSSAPILDSESHLVQST
jgi:hypothetical protein